MNNSKVHKSVRVANEIGDSKNSTFTEQMNCVLTSFSMKIRKLNETFKYVSFGLLSYKRRIRNLLQFVFRLFCFAFFPGYIDTLTCTMNCLQYNRWKMENNEHNINLENCQKKVFIPNFYSLFENYILQIAFSSQTVLLRFMSIFSYSNSFKWFETGRPCDLSMKRSIIIFKFSDLFFDWPVLTAVKCLDFFCV